MVLKKFTALGEKFLSFWDALKGNNNTFILGYFIKREKYLKYKYKQSNQQGWYGNE